MKLNFWYRFFFYSLIAIFFIYLRTTIDKENLFITSDGQIKFFQAQGYMQNGFSSFECLYPGKEVDPQFKHFIFDYPWGFVGNFKTAKCFFQYPPFFSYIGTIFLAMFGLKSVMYISILFYFLCILLLDRILEKLSVKPFLILMGNLLVFGISFITLTMLDFSEMSFYHLFLLVELYILLEMFQTPSHFNSKAFVLGTLLVFHYFIRAEIALYVVILLPLLLLSRKEISVPKLALYSFLGAILPTILILYFNYWSVENLLGMRTFTVLNDTTDEFRRGFAYHLKMAKAYLWADEEMKGIIQAFPAILLSLFFLIPIRFASLDSFSKLCFLSGGGYILLGSFFTPVKGGVQNFGLRYLETGFIPLSIALVTGLNTLLNEWNWESSKSSKYKFHKALKYALFFFLALSIYTTYKFTREGFKNLIRTVPLYTQLQKYFSEIGNGYVIHDTINTPYMVGISYINQKHIYVGNDDDFLEIEKKLFTKKINNFIIFSFEGKPYISINVPKHLHYKHYSKIAAEPVYYKKYKEEKILNFKLKYYSLIP